MKTNFVLLLLLSQLIGCSQNQTGKLPMVAISDVKVADLDPHNLGEPITAKLSQIAENLHAVLLETDTNCLLSGEVYFNVGEKYITAIDNSGVYQFSPDGSFIRKLLNIGRGPGEIPRIWPERFLMEDEDLFLAVSSNSIYCYRLSTGEFLGIKGEVVLKPREQLVALRYLGDSLILFSYRKYRVPNSDVPIDSLGCGVKLQHLSGNILWQKKFNYNSVFTLGTSNLLGGSNIFILGTNNQDEYILQINDQDTVYSMNISSLLVEPELLKRSEKQKIDGYPVERTVINCLIEDEEFARINSYQIMNFRYVSNIVNNKPEGYRYIILYDDKNKLAYNIGTFENDYLGFIHKTEGDMESFHNFPILLNPVGKLVERYDAIEFLQLTKEALDNSELDETVRKRIEELSSKITEYSNPILVVGDIKKKIDL